MKHLLRRLLGVLLLGVGVALLFLPGPGTLFILLGLLMMSEGTPWGRTLRWRLLRAYVRIRRKTKKPPVG